MIDKRRRLVAALLSLGAALSVCAFAARAPGHGIATVLGNSAGVPGTWTPCDSAGLLRLYAQGIGYDIALNPQCAANASSQGSTVHSSCPDSAVLHVANVITGVCAPVVGCLDPGSGANQVLCQSSMTFSWKDTLSCSAAVKAVNNGKCQSVTLTANVGGE